MARDLHGKGRQIEKLAIAEIEKEGFVCWQPPRTKFQKQDICYLFDFLCVSKEGTVMRFVQVKSGNLQEKKDKFLSRIKGFCTSYPYVKKEFWEYKKEKFKKTQY